jgi:hypothetical protein
MSIASSRRLASTPLSQAFALPRIVASLWLLLPACSLSLPEQKALIQRHDLRLHKLSSEAVLQSWGAPAYEHRELTQFYRLSNGQLVPQFRVPIGESPKDWDLSMELGEGYFLAYPDRGELLGFFDDRLVYREQLKAEQIQEIGKGWRHESRFKMNLNESVVRP